VRNWRSVRFRLVLGFLAILFPLVLFMLYINMYAMRIVQEQITAHYSSLLKEQLAHQDRLMKYGIDYLSQLEFEPDLHLIQSLSPGDDEYELAKIRLHRRFILDVNAFSLMDTLFLYTEKENDLLFATTLSYNAEAKSEALLRRVEESRSGAADVGLAERRWDFLTVGDTEFLVTTVSLGSGVIGGVLVAVDELQQMLGNFDVGPGGGYFLADSEGRLRSRSDFPPVGSEAFRRTAVASEGVAYGVLHEGQSYIVISQRSQEADLHFVLVTTRSHLLKNLPFFQKMMYFWIPLAAAVLLALYLGFLQRVMFLPLARLIQGMRQIGQGNFQVRLPVGAENNEFSFVSGTFNRMAEQIEKLKIDVYEEQLRLQEAEYRHLQIQINPHFYMNSLNIIYNLAALKDYRSVQKLSLHLAEYFRFLMLSHRTVVRLEDEIRHIRHYLEIQKMRYVSKLDYEIRVDPAHEAVPVSPLILQPFVENSVIHGFGGRKPDGEPFRIVIWSEDDPADPGMIRLTLADNGPGFPAAVLETLNSGAEFGPQDRERVGIWNVLRRFRMLYGGEGGISFRNAPEGGAVVEVRLPARSAHVERFESSAFGPSAS